MLKSSTTAHPNNYLGTYMQLEPTLPKEEDSFPSNDYQLSDEATEYPEEEHLKPFNECNFEESTYYYVWVSCRYGNPPFKAVIYTGFRSGSYRGVYCGGDRVIQFDHRAKFKIITKIGKSGY